MSSGNATSRAGLKVRVFSAALQGHPEVTLQGRRRAAQRTIADIAAAIAPASPVGTEQEQQAAADIVSAVRQRGDAAVLEYTRLFDWPRATAAGLRVRPREIEEAQRSISSRTRKALATAIERIRNFHQVRKPSDWLQIGPDGAVLGHRFTPVDSAAVYVPAGTAPLPSSLIMGAVAAQVAGVPRIVVATPPRRDGTINPVMLATAGLLGLKEIYKAGGAQAIAALAFGTKTIPAVDKITGPGIVYVQIAKRMVFGQVGIDGLYGPSELVILADDSANPHWLAADLAAQAEHVPVAGPGPVVALVTPSRRLLTATAAALHRHVKQFGSAVRRSIEQAGALVHVKSLDQGADLVNLLAPEHLQVSTRNPLAILPKIRHAGCIVMGHWSTVPVGDYLAGPNHLLPTGRSARFSSGLSAAEFMKASSVIGISADWLAKYGPTVRHLATLEGLTAHAQAVAVRERK